MTEEERKTLSAIGKHETMSKEPTAREKLLDETKRIVLCRSVMAAEVVVLFSSLRRHGEGRHGWQP